MRLWPSARPLLSPIDSPPSGVADMVVVLQEGRFVEQGSFKELLEMDGVFRRLYRMQWLDSKIPTGS